MAERSQLFAGGYFTQHGIKRKIPEINQIAFYMQAGSQSQGRFGFFVVLRKRFQLDKLVADSDIQTVGECKLTQKDHCLFVLLCQFGIHILEQDQAVFKVKRGKRSEKQRQLGTEFF